MLLQKFLPGSLESSNRTIQKDRISSFKKFSKDFWTGEVIAFQFAEFKYFELVYYAVGQSLLQSEAHFNTKRGKHYYKVGQLHVITKWGESYQKVGHVIYNKAGQLL